MSSCPICQSPVTERTRGIPQYSICSKGHKFLSTAALAAVPTPCPCAVCKHFHPIPTLEGSGACAKNDHITKSDRWCDKFESKFKDNGWIKVSTRLPDPKVPVLVLFGELATPRVTVMVRLVSGEWQHDEYEGPWLYSSVFAWRPIPELPVW